MAHVEDAFGHPLFLKLLNYCLILETGIKFIWQWMSTQDSAFDNITSNPRIPFLWRGSVVRSMVGAQEYHMEVFDSKSRCADSIIEVTLRAMEAKRTTNVEKLRTMSLRTATIETHRILTTGGRWDHTNGMLWDRFR